MKPKEVIANVVWAQVDATVNTGNFENIKIQMGESITIPAEEDATAVRLSLYQRLKRDVTNEYEKIKEAL